MRRGITVPATISTVGGEYERNGSGVWSSSVGAVAGSTPAKKAHLDDLRTALIQAYHAALQRIAGLHGVIVKHLDSLK